MNNIKIISLIFVLYIGNQAFGQNIAPGMITKRWKITNHVKAGKAVALLPNDYMQFNTDGSFEQVVQNFYAKGSWAANTDILTINNKGAYHWKVTEQSDSIMKANRGEENIELVVYHLPVLHNKSLSKKNQIISGKWKITEHKKGENIVKEIPDDFIIFYSDGTLEKVHSGNYAKEEWKFNVEETEIVIHGETWEIESLSPLFFKIIKPKQNEILIMAKTH